MSKVRLRVKAHQTGDNDLSLKKRSPSAPSHFVLFNAGIIKRIQLYKKKRPFLGNVKFLVRILLWGGAMGKGECMASWQATPLTWNPLRMGCGWWLCRKMCCGGFPGVGGWISGSPWES